MGYVAPSRSSEIRVKPWDLQALSAAFRSWPLLLLLLLLLMVSVGGGMMLRAGRLPIYALWARVRQRLCGGVRDW
jgi:hypothetical protein